MVVGLLLRCVRVKQKYSSLRDSIGRIFPFPSDYRRRWWGWIPQLFPQFSLAGGKYLKRLGGLRTDHLLPANSVPPLLPGSPLRRGEGGRLRSDHLRKRPAIVHHRD